MAHCTLFKHLKNCNYFIMSVTLNGNKREENCYALYSFFCWWYDIRWDDVLTSTLQLPFQFCSLFRSSDYILNIKVCTYVCMLAYLKILFFTNLYTRFHPHCKIMCLYVMLCMYVCTLCHINLAKCKLKFNKSTELCKWDAYLWWMSPCRLPTNITTNLQPTFHNPSISS